MSKKRDDLKPEGLFKKKSSTHVKSIFDLDTDPNDSIEVPSPITYDAMTNSTTIGNIAISSVGIVYIPDDVSEDEWLSTFIMANQMAKAVWWIIADLAAFASDKWGQKYEWIADKFGYTPETIKNMAYIARSVQLSSRDDNLTPKHHRYVASLTKNDQKKYLTMAIEKGWSSAQLAFYIEHGRIPATVGVAGQFEMALMRTTKKYTGFFKKLGKKKLTDGEFRAIKHSANLQIKEIRAGLSELERNIVED